MELFLGIDTSNYTTSAALYCAKTGRIVQRKKLLPVRFGEVGLRQSDAVFHHVKQLPEIIEKLFSEEREFIGENRITSVGASARPRDEEGSYMPCFLTGLGFSQSLSSVNSIPSFSFCHQAGHIAAALYSVKRADLFNEKFIAFHLSGGTTECLLVEPDDERIIKITKIAGSLDLKAGQAVDRVGVAMGLEFPAGRHMEELALKSHAKFKIKPVLKGLDCCLSGIENQSLKKLSDGVSKEDVAKFCLLSIYAALDAMTSAVTEKYGDLPLVYAGGVMSNSIIKNLITKKYPKSMFAEPQFSADNAAGIALLTEMRFRRNAHNADSERHSAQPICEK